MWTKNGWVFYSRCGHFEDGAIYPSFALTVFVSSRADVATDPLPSLFFGLCWPCFLSQQRGERCWIREREADASFVEGREEKTATHLKTEDNRVALPYHSCFLADIDTSYLVQYVVKRQPMKAIISKVYYRHARHDVRYSADRRSVYHRMSFYCFLMCRRITAIAWRVVLSLRRK